MVACGFPSFRLMDQAHSYRMVFCGNETPAQVCLREFLSEPSIEIALVVHPDQDQGLRGVCQRFSLPAITFEELRKRGTGCLPTPPDLLLNVTTDFIFSDPFLAWPKLGAFNLHPGPLPRYAGFYPYVWSVINGESEHGVTLHRMTQRIDVGNVLAIATFPLTPRDTGLSVYTKCGLASREVVKRLVEILRAGTLTETSQDLAQRKYYRREVPFGARINFQWPSEAVERFVRALDFRPFKNPLRTPWAACGERVVECLDVEQASVAHRAAPGDIVAVDEEGPIVACGVGAVHIRTINGMPGREGWHCAGLGSAIRLS